MHSTKALLGRGSVSTNHGQQRILKHSTPDLVTYIQKAVQTGIYRSNEEIEAMNQSLQENPQDLKRIRWHVPRGSKIQDYPKEYEILSLNPPAPFRPKMPLKDQRKAMNKYIQEHRPTDRLARNFLAREEKATTSGEPATAEEYYQRLLGANKAPKANSAMGTKSALLNKAYAFAVKQHHLMRTENMDEKAALSKVEEMLKEQDVQEKKSSRSKAEDLANNRNMEKSMTPNERAKEMFPRLELQQTTDNDDPDDSKLAVMYSDEQKSFEGMISWTHRLQAVPYRQWTVGASVSLDHWIAKRVLGLSEETWLELLEGDSPELLGRGRDIVTARHALFPETILEEEELSRQEAVDDSKNDEMSTRDALDQILQGLESWEDGDDYSSSSDFGIGESDNSGDKILRLTNELQQWRAKQVESDFESWSDSDKTKFKNWLEDYVSTLTPDSALGKVDMEGTRKALLDAPPLYKEDSDSFWDSIRDETAAEVFLQRMLSAKNTDGDDTSSHPFWQLDYDLQLKRLVQLGSIRDIADEYSSESDRSRFLARYGDYLLEGLELDHLVPDPQGPIRGSDLSERLQKHHKVEATDRFRLEQLPYGTDEFGTDAAKRARSLFKAWNQYKAGRAHYEEKLFQRGILGLTYEKQK